MSASPQKDPNIDPSIRYETVRTCACGSALHDGPVWGWGVCSSCDTWVNTRRPTVDSLGAVYGETYWTVTQSMAGVPPLEKRFEVDMNDRVPVYLEALAAVLPPGAKVCEVGCGNARLLHELKGRGFDVVGTEMLQSTIDRVAKLTDVPIRRGGAEVLEAGTFDAVLSIDVLEHLHDPLAFLKEQAALLKPGGVMLVHTPVHEASWEPYGYSAGTLWKLYHLYLFSRSLIERLFQEAGLDVLSAYPRVFGWPVFVLRKR